jgi:hypothetical protein
MTWDYQTGAAAEAAGAGRDEPIELVGTHLRVSGVVALGRFGRLSDLINALSGYVKIRDARLLRRNGDPTNTVLPELMVDQGEISFIAQTDPAAPEGAAAAGSVDPRFEGATTKRSAREFVIFTPGHMVSGRIHVFGDTDLAGFVDATDPRFIPVTDVTARSLADRRVISHYKFVLLNRTQMIAASEVGRTGDIVPEDVPEL